MLVIISQFTYSRLMQFKCRGTGERVFFLLSFMWNGLVLSHFHHCTAIYFKYISKRFSFRQRLSFTIKLFLFLLLCSPYLTIIIKLLLLTFRREFKACDSRFCVRNFWISLLFHFMQWLLMLQVYIYIYLFIYIYSAHCSRPSPLSSDSD